MSSISGISGAGSAWAAAGNQRSQHQAKMFAKVDSDGSGSVDATELGEMFNDIQSKTGVSLGDSSQMLTQMDSNGDGSLSSDELDQGMKSLMPPPPSTMAFAQSRGGDGSSGDDLFSKIDSNGDGSLDSDEIQALTDKIAAETGDDLSDTFAALDADGDGQLSEAEFAAGKPDGPPGQEGMGGKGMPPVGGPPPAGGPGGPGGPGGAGASEESESTSYDPLDVNKDGVVSEMERLAGTLKELAASGSDSSDSVQSEIAKLAQKLYEQISSGKLDGASSESSLSVTA